MTTKNRTTADLTDRAKLVKKSFMKYSGLKNALSAGLIVLNELDNDDLIKAVAQSQGLKSDLDIYSDRKKLIEIKAIIEKSHGQDSRTIEIDPDNTRRLKTILDSIKSVSLSPWHVAFYDNYETKIEVQQSKMDDFKKTLGPSDDDDDPAKRIVDASADGTKVGGKKKTKDGSKPA